MADPKNTLPPNPYDAPQDTETIWRAGAPTMAEDVFASAEQNDNLKMLGLSWQQNGLRYEISEGDLLHRTQPIVTKTHIGLDSKILGSHHTKIEHDVHNTRRYVVRVFGSDGVLRTVHGMDKNQVGSALNSLDVSKGDARPVWVKRPEYETAYAGKKNISIPACGDKSVVETVFESQEKEGLSSTIGLTWNRDGMKYQVVDDVVVTEFSSPYIGRTQVDIGRPVRTWVVKTTNAAGDTVAQAVLAESDFAKFIPKSDADKTNTGMRWEVPKNLPKRTLGPHERAWMNQFAFGNLTSLQPSASREALIEATKLLEHRREMLKGYARKLADEKIEDYKFTLERTVSEFGFSQVIKLAQELHGEYIRDINTLGFGEAADPQDISWALWDLIQQRHHARRAARNRGKADDGYVAVFGDMPLVDPFADYPEAKSKRREIVDHNIGREFERQAVRIKRVNTYRGAGLEVSENPQALLKVQDIIRPEVEQILKKVKEEKHLSSAKVLARLGRQLRRSINR